MTYVYNLLKHFLTYLGSEHLHLIKEQECADVRNFRSNKDCGFKSIQQRTSTAQDVCVCVVAGRVSLLRNGTEMCLRLLLPRSCQEPIQNSREQQQTTHSNTLHCNAQLFNTILYYNMELLPTHYSILYNTTLYTIQWSTLQLPPVMYTAITRYIFHFLYCSSLLNIKLFYKQPRLI